MAKVIYCKRREFKLFGFKIFELNTNYNEHSNDENTNDDDFYIELRERENRNG
jgi:hypothetical protein